MQHVSYVQHAVDNCGTDAWTAFPFDGLLGGSVFDLSHMKKCPNARCCQNQRCFLPFNIGYENMDADNHIMSAKCVEGIGICPGQITHLFQSEAHGSKCNSHRSKENFTTVSTNVTAVKHPLKRNVHILPRNAYKSELAVVQKYKK